MAIFSSFSPSSPSPPSETPVVPVKRSGFCDACSAPTPMLRLCLGPDSRRRSEQGSGDYRPGRQVGTRGAGPWGSGVGGLLHIRGQGTRFLTSDQCWLGQGSWVPVIAQGRRTLCRVQRRDPPSRGNRSRLPGCSEAHRPEFSRAGTRTEAPGKSCTSLQRTSRASQKPRRSKAGRDSPSPPTRRPARTRQRPERRGVPECVGVLPGMGRVPLTISTWRGSSWLGGAGTENWIFLRSLGSMAGGVVDGERGARLGVRGDAPGSARQRCSGRRGDSGL